MVAGGHARLPAWGRSGPRTSTSDPKRSVVLFADGGEMPFDLSRGVSHHRVPQVVADPAICEVPVTRSRVHLGRLRRRRRPLVAQYREVSAALTYDGVGTCYVEFGQHTVARVEVTFCNG